ncbi:MAG: DNA replication complex GINS family protein [Thermococci archaeon]|nr:DNA replication complex GINS family protein [Thermococci archaeon]
MLVGRAVIAVKVLEPFEGHNTGDVVLLEDWKAKVLWEEGVVDVIDESDKVIGEIEKLIREEMASEPLVTLPEGLYERTEFYIEYLKRSVKNGDNIDIIDVQMKKLSNLVGKYRKLKEVRFKKILEAVRLRPGSLEILSRLSPEERGLYLDMSRMRRRWLGEER